MKKLLKEAEAIENKYINKYDLPNNPQTPDIKSILAPSKDYVRALTAEECYVNCSVLLSYKQAANKLIAATLSTLHLLESYVNQIHGKYWESIGSGPWDIRRQAINNDQSYLRPIIKHINILTSEKILSENLLKIVDQQIYFYEELGKARKFA